MNHGNKPFTQLAGRNKPLRGNSNPLPVHQSDVRTSNFDNRRGSYGGGFGKFGSRQRLQETLLGFKNRHKLQQILAKKIQSVQRLQGKHRGDAGSFNGRLRSSGKKSRRQQNRQRQRLPWRRSIFG